MSYDKDGRYRPATGPHEPAVPLPEGHPLPPGHDFVDFNTRAVGTLHGTGVKPPLITTKFVVCEGAPIYCADLRELFERQGDAEAFDYAAHWVCWFDCGDRAAGGLLDLIQINMGEHIVFRRNPLGLPWTMTELPLIGEDAGTAFFQDGTPAFASPEVLHAAYERHGAGDRPGVVSAAFEDVLLGRWGNTLPDVTLSFMRR